MPTRCCGQANRVPGARWFISTLDLTKGYWQLPLTEQAKEKTPSSTPDGLYQYWVLPFGVPTTFQHMMDKILRPNKDYTAAYLHDTVIHISDLITHLKRLEAVLRALRQAGRVANPNDEPRMASSV